MRIYISIPMQGRDLERQRDHAAEVAIRLKALGHEPINPFDTPPPPTPLCTDEEYAYYMGEDIKRLLLCDVVYVCNGWKHSRGCRAEVCLARIYHLSVYDKFSSIPFR